MPHQHGRRHNRMVIALPKTSLRDQHPKDNMKWISNVIKEFKGYATKDQKKITWMDSVALSDALAPSSAALEALARRRLHVDN